MSWTLSTALPEPAPKNAPLNDDRKFTCTSLGPTVMVSTKPRNPREVTCALPKVGTSMWETALMCPSPTLPEMPTNEVIPVPPPPPLTETWSPQAGTGGVVVGVRTSPAPFQPTTCTSAQTGPGVPIPGCENGV